MYYDPLTAAESTSLPARKPPVKPPGVTTLKTCPHCQGEDAGCGRCDGRGFVDQAAGHWEYLYLQDSAGLDDYLRRLEGKAEEAETRCRHLHERRSHRAADRVGREGVLLRVTALALRAVIARGPTPPAATQAQAEPETPGALSLAKAWRDDQKARAA